MLQFHCCGVANYTDWAQTIKYSSNTNVPDSCCRVETRSCGEHSRGIQFNDPIANDDDEIPVYTQVGHPTHFFARLHVISVFRAVWVKYKTG
jgi:hypothetical protein